MLIENNVLTVDGHTEELPRLATPGVVHVWKVPTEYRESGYFVSVQAPEEPMEIPACGANEMQFVGRKKLAPDSDAFLAHTRRQAILEELELLDRAAVRPLRAVAAGTATPEDTDMIEQIESDALALRDELAGLD